MIGSKREYIDDEVGKYDHAAVDEESLEIDVFNSDILSRVIRERELRIVTSVTRQLKPSLTLDVGCGSGWLTTFLAEAGLEVVGIDVSKELVKIGKENSIHSEFLVCDAHHLPFKDKTFDFIVGMGVLHHLHHSSIAEISRVCRSDVLFMEPNKINFLSHVGRRFFPMEIHTIGEEPFFQWHLKTLLEQFRINVKKTTYLFAVSFPLARILKLLKAEAPSFLISFVLLVERIAERFPIIRRTNSIIVIQGEVK